MNEISKFLKFRNFSKGRSTRPISVFETIWPIDRSFRPLYRYQAANTSRGCTISWINFQTHRFPSHAYRIFERDQTTQSGTSTSDKTNDRSTRMQLDSRFVRSAKIYIASVGLKPRPFHRARPFLTDLHQHKLPREGNGSSSRRSLQIASSSTNKLLNYFSFNGKRKGNVATSWAERMLRASLGMVIVRNEEPSKCNGLVQLRG